MERCGWAGTDPENVRYHDEEWGRPVTDDNRLFEKLCLEGFQSGLSWLTILKKRPQFRKQFKNFDPVKVAKMTEADVERLLQDAGIIRHRGKIEAAVKGARIFLDIEGAEGFSPFIWSFVDGRPVQNRFASMAEVPASTPQSESMAKALKKRGFNFCGPVIAYAFMQACGLVNDHMTHCPRHGCIMALSPAG